MPETALLTAFYLLFLTQFKFKNPDFGEVDFFASPLFKTPVFWEYHILPGHRLLSVLAERSRFSLNEAFIIPEVPA